MVKAGAPPNRLPTVKQCCTERESSGILKRSQRFVGAYLPLSLATGGKELGQNRGFFSNRERINAQPDATMPNAIDHTHVMPPSARAGYSSSQNTPEITLEAQLPPKCETDGLLAEAGRTQAIMWQQFISQHQKESTT